MACLVPGVVLLQPLAACRVLQHPGMTARPVLYPRTWLWLQSDRFSPQSLEVGILYISRGSFCRLQACFADRGRLLRVVVVLSAWADCLAEDICMRAQAPARPPRPVFLRNPHGSAAAAWPFGGRRRATLCCETPRLGRQHIMVKGPHAPSAWSKPAQYLFTPAAWVFPATGFDALTRALTRMLRLRHLLLCLVGCPVSGSVSIRWRFLGVVDAVSQR